MRDLKFVEPTLLPTRKRPSVTIRVGEKWADLRPGDKVRVVSCYNPHRGDCIFAGEPGSAKFGRPCVVHGVAEIKQVVTCDLHKAPARLLEYAHNPKCRTYSGMCDVLEGIYGESLGQEKIVLILFEMVD